jgi:multicomponent Na+:H+ antiporter subunit E
MYRAVGLVGLLFAFWLLLSGIFEPFLIGAGLACAIAVAALARRMDVIDHEGQPLHLGLAAVSYWPWLAKEIVKSGWDVSRRVLDPRLPISPTVVRIKPSQRTVVGLATHANSITLTPGTVTMDVARGEFLVHALTREGAEGAAGGEMDGRVSRFEGSA